MGYNTTLLPCIDISASDNPPNFSAVDTAELVLFTSVNAIEYANQDKPLPWRPTATGIGNVSTATLAELGQNDIQQAIPPFTSEGFVERLKQSHVKNLVIIKGNGGRTVIQEACTELDIRCTTIEVYKRTVPVYRSDDIDVLLSTNPPTVICATSNEVLENLITLTPDVFLLRLRALPLIVNSQRSVALAKDLGFSSIIIVANPPGDEGQLRALAQLKEG